MDWYVLDVIIYGRGSETRVLPLTRGVNIITGDSQTGKSAVIPIVDYCMGARSCRIPVGPIREFATWYAVRMQVGSEQLFIARRDPGARSTTRAMHIIMGREIALPEREDLTGNTDRDAVIDELSRRLGMMELPVADAPLDTAFTEPPSVRSTAFFLFQPQNVVANQDVLFYKTSEGDKKARLKRLFPYLLGAVDLDYFRLRGELDNAQRALNALTRRLEQERAGIDTNLSAARALYTRAVDLGLLPPPGEPPSEASELRARLQSATEAPRSAAERRATVPGDAVRIAALQDESRRIRMDMVEVRQHLADVQGLAADADGAMGALQIQGGRLRAVDLLPVREGEPVTQPACPVCAQPTDLVIPPIERLHAMQTEVRQEIEGLTGAPAALLGVRDRLNDEFNAARGRLRMIESELATLYRGTENAAAADEVWVAQERHLGAMRFFLDRWFGNSVVPATLFREHAAAQRDVEKLRTRLEEFDASDRLQAALSAIGARMQELSRRLKVERPGAALWLDINNLTVVRDSPTGRPERLWQIGGGENHVGYHLCALFALHSFFLSRERPVPSFLFIDQPSQVYFPEEGEGAKGPKTDWVAVRRIYQMIFDTAKELEGLQVVIFDHANFKDEEFQGAVKHRWRDGKKLI